MSEWKIQSALLLLWFVLISFSIAMDNAGLGREAQAHGTGNDVDLVARRAIRDLEQRVDKLER